MKKFVSFVATVAMICLLSTALAVTASIIRAMIPVLPNKEIQVYMRIIATVTIMTTIIL